MGEYIRFFLLFKSLQKIIYHLPKIVMQYKFNICKSKINEEYNKNGERSSERLLL